MNLPLPPKFAEPICKIVTENGKNYLTDTNGNKLPRQIFVRVHQELDEPAYAIVKIFVNLTDNEKNN